MGAHRYQSTWRSLTFNRAYDDTGLVDDPAHLVSAYLNSDYRLESFDPTSVQTVDYREMRQHLEGADPNQSFEGVRLLVGQGTILGSTPADLEDKTWAMYEAFSPAACRIASLATDPKGVLPFDFKRATSGGSKALRFYAKPAAGRPIVVGRMREGLSRRFMFQLVATDPFAYDQTLTQVNWPVSGSISNPGNMYVRPKIVLTMSGAGHASTVFTNVTTLQGFTVDLSGTINGSVVTIDTAAATILLNGTTDWISKLTAGFLTNAFLLPGANTVGITNAQNITQARADFRGAYA